MNSWYRQTGSHATGGAYDYRIGGRMTSGFALVAWLGVAIPLLDELERAGRREPSSASANPRGKWIDARPPKGLTLCGWAC